MNEPMTQLVSVIIPCFNASRFIADAIASVLDQTYPRVEIIVVNDGSSDGSRELLRQLEPLVTVIDQTNSGRSAARNRGLDSSAGELVLFLDADDILERNHIATLVESLEGRGSDIAYCKAKNFLSYQPDKDLTYHYRCFEGRESVRIIERNFIYIHTAVVRKAILVSTGVRFTVGREYGEDWEFWSRLILHGAKVTFVDKVFARIRVHSGNTSANLERMQIETIEILDSLNREFCTANNDLEMQHLFARAKARAWFQLATVKLFVRKIPEGRSIMRNLLNSVWLLRTIDICRLPFLFAVSSLKSELPSAAIRVIYGQHCALRQRLRHNPNGSPLGGQSGSSQAIH